MIRLRSHGWTNPGLVRRIAAAVSALLLVGALDGCTAGQTPQCSLDAVNETQAQLNGGHKDPITPTAFTREFIAKGLSLVCAGDYELSFGADPYPSSVAIVTGSDPVATVQAVLPDSKNIAATSDYGLFESGYDVVTIEQVTLSDYPDRTDLWAIEYIKDYNK